MEDIKVKPSKYSILARTLSLPQCVDEESTESTNKPVIETTNVSNNNQCYCRTVTVCDATTQTV